MEWYGEMGHGKLWRSRWGRAWSVGVGSGVAVVVRFGLVGSGVAVKVGLGLV